MLPINLIFLFILLTGDHSFIVNSTYCIKYTNYVAQVNTPGEQIQIKILPQQIEGKETLSHSKALSKI
jgi:hypothetical protein